MALWWIGSLLRWQDQKTPLKGLPPGRRRRRRVGPELPWVQVDQKGGMRQLRIGRPFLSHRNPGCRGGQDP